MSKEANDFNKLIIEFRRSLWLNPMIMLGLGLILTAWLIGKGEMLEIAETTSFIKMYVERMHKYTAIAIFCLLFMSLLYNSVQMLLIYKMISKLVSSKFHD